MIFHREIEKITFPLRALIGQPMREQEYLESKPIYLLSDILLDLDQHNEAYVSALTSVIIEVSYTFFHQLAKFFQLNHLMNHTM